MNEQFGSREKAKSPNAIDIIPAKLGRSPYLAACTGKREKLVPT